MGVVTRTNEIMVNGPEGNERAWTFSRLPEDKRSDAEAVMRVREVNIWDGVQAEDQEQNRRGNEEAR